MGRSPSYSPTGAGDDDNLVPEWCYCTHNPACANNIPSIEKNTSFRRMKKYLLLVVLAYLPSLAPFAQIASYTPSPQNEQARAWFSDAKFGLFIHWGPFSIPGDGEWVMNNRNITVKNYTRLEKFFNPIDFDAHTWVSLAKTAGMKYITLITRHHDGFSMWDTKYS